VPIDELKKQAPEQLEWFHDVNYHIPGPNRHPWPAFFIGDHDLTQSIKDMDIGSEYCWFISGNNQLPDTFIEPALWGAKHHELISFAQDNSVNLVPRHTKLSLYLKSSVQVYDYENLQRRRQVPSQKQDIVFISYDEPQADDNYEILVNRFPNARRVHGVEGMENALRAAAEASTTPWFFATFAKTRLHEDWDFSFVPDRWQAPKHYIFNALNTSNGLCYGHMGIILYHKDTVLNSKPWDEINGLDYTMSFDTESIPITSVYGEFATDPYRAWRTAFRETAKLVQWYLDNKCVETFYRLKVWQTHAQGPYAEWVIRGAKDGIAYYDEHLMDHGALKQMFRWDWLKNYFVELYGEPGRLSTPPAMLDSNLLEAQSDWKRSRPSV
jgi:hypothetical protein